MFWYLTLYRTLKERDRQDPSSNAYTSIVFFHVSRLILCVIGIIAFIVMCCMSFFPDTGGYDNFRPYGTVNAYLNLVDGNNGYSAIFFDADNFEYFSTPVTKSRYQELEYLCENDPYDTLYCLNVYRTGVRDDFVSTYADQTTEEAWKDYKAALRDNSVKRHIPFYVISAVVSVIFVIIFIFVYRKLQKDREEHKMLLSTASSGPAPSPAVIPPVIHPTADEKTSSENRESDDLSDEIDSFDPGNITWHK